MVPLIHCDYEKINSISFSDLKKINELRYKTIRVNTLKPHYGYFGMPIVVSDGFRNVIKILYKTRMDTLSEFYMWTLTDLYNIDILNDDKLSSTNLNDSNLWINRKVNNKYLYKVGFVDVSYKTENIIKYCMDRGEKIKIEKKEYIWKYDISNDSVVLFRNNLQVGYVIQNENIEFLIDYY
jgi:hypothetical protein